MAMKSCIDPAFKASSALDEEKTVKIVDAKGNLRYKVVFSS